MVAQVHQSTLNIPNRLHFEVGNHFTRICGETFHLMQETVAETLIN